MNDLRKFQAKEKTMDESEERSTPSTSAGRVDLEDFTAAVLRGVLRATEARGSAEGATEVLRESTDPRPGPRYPGDILLPGEIPFPITFGLIMDQRWPPREPPEQ